MFRKLAILSFTILALFLVFIVVYSFFAAPEAEDDRRALSPEDYPNAVDPQVNPSATAPATLETATGITWTVTNEYNEITHQYLFTHIEPLPDNLYQVEEPQAWYFPSNNRAVHIKADRGQIFAPDNRPQSGSFEGNIVITFYQSRKGERLDLSDGSPQIAFNLYLDEATFDAALGKAESTGLVRLVGPEVEFEGLGLTLIYNEPENRINLLEIHEGRYLRYTARSVEAGLNGAVGASGSGGANEARTEGGPAASTGESGRAPIANTGGGEAKDSAGSRGAPAKSADLQYYQVQFERDVHVESDKGSIDAAQLTALLAFNRSSGGTKGASSTTTPPPAAPKPVISSQDGSADAGEKEAEVTRPVVQSNPNQAIDITSGGGNSGAMQAVTGTGSGSGDDGGGVATANSSTERGGRDEPTTINLTWSGSMVVTPAEDKPDQLQTDDDFILTFTGAPVIAVSKKDEKIVGQYISYRDSDQRIIARGSEAYGLEVSSPESGRATAEQLMISLKTGRGELRGAGRIESAEAGPVQPGINLPDRFTLSWSDHVNLVFDKPSEQKLELRKADFFGDVAARDPRFAMSSGSLHSDFEKGEISSVNATGRVRVQTDRGMLMSDNMQITTELNAAGKRVPGALVATGNVDLSDPTRRIQAGSLKAVLAMKEEVAEAAGVEGSEESGEDATMAQFRNIRKVYASEDVHLTLEDGEEVWAETLVADPPAKSIVMTGSPLRIVNANSEFLVQNLTILEDGKTAEAKGSGAFNYRQVATPKHGARTLHVVWTDGMKYSDAAHQIDLSGNVVATASDKANEENRLTAGQLTLELVNPDVTTRVNQPLDVSASSGESGDVLDKAALTLRKLTARQSVVMLSSRWRDDERQELATRLRIAGPILTFDNSAENLLVNGPGSMLIEDYRASSGKPATGPMAISGQGLTAVTWAGDMSMNGAQYSVTFERDVYMTHEPAGSTNRVDLRCHNMVLDMKGIGGLRALQTSEVQTLQIDHFQATGKVHLSDSTYDILANRMFYDGTAETVRMTALPNELVEVSQKNQPRPFQGEKLLWNLKTNRIEIDAPAY